ncbi:MAG TPA: hypothetical protein P5550_02490 [Bacteroidales bacterium]|nr:hypothetical protein [Bacteroidales bacterium]HRZ75802.1 hypothetical protein [Bacteroidales bacterium]
MIEETCKVHDKFSLELKLAFIARKKLKLSDFSVNAWLFVPNSLDVNRATFTKRDIYRTIKSNIRLITPVYILRDIADQVKPPFQLLQQSFERMVSRPTRTHVADYEYHIRMFVSIVKSALREEIRHYRGTEAPGDQDYLVEEFLHNLGSILQHYRSLRRVLNVPTVNGRLMDYYLFGDEYLSNLAEQHTYRLIEAASSGRQGPAVQKKLMTLVNSEIAYRVERGFAVVEKESPNRNRDLIFRLGLLKKYAESELFLNIDKRKDGIWLEQLYISIAAGLSMIFATAVAFSFQQKYGNLTMPFFVALVVSYMLKDRIKELSRYFLIHRMGHRFFDHKTKVSLGDQHIGWSKEAVDFVSGSKVPAEVLRIRNRSAILEADNRSNSEKVILYRRLVRLRREALDAISQHPVEGMNDIIRFNISPFLLNMDDPVFPLFSRDEKGGVRIVKGEKIYYLNLVLEFRNEAQHDYKRYRIAFNRKGIRELEQF